MSQHIQSTAGQRSVPSPLVSRQTSPSDKTHSFIPQRKIFAHIFCRCDRTAGQPACIDHCTHARAYVRYLRTTYGVCAALASVSNCQTDQAAMSKPRCCSSGMFPCSSRSLPWDLILVRDLAESMQDLVRHFELHVVFFSRSRCMHQIFEQIVRKKQNGQRMVRQNQVFEAHGTQACN